MGWIGRGEPPRQPLEPGRLGFGVGGARGVEGAQGGLAADEGGERLGRTAEPVERLAKQQCGFR
jgi:hypothetical protein